MNTERQSSIELARAILQGYQERENLHLILCPPVPFALDVLNVVDNSSIRLGAQNMYYKEEGAYTGEVSPSMLLSVGCQYVILGHSERRTIFGETDNDVKLKMCAAIGHGLIPIVCVGETEGERESGETFSLLKRQLEAAFEEVLPEDGLKTVVAYEPIWAIGTGKTATPEIAQEAHRYIRRLLQELVSSSVAGQIPILYGGSVKPSNAAELFVQPDIDGGLIGGASLIPKDFLAIVQAPTI